MRQAHGHRESTGMNPRDRVLAALQRREPDRVPVMEMAIDWKVIGDLGYRSYFDAVDALDLDAIGVNQVCYMLGLMSAYIKFRGVYRDHWGATMRLTGELLPDVIEHPIKDAADLRRYKPPDPSRDMLLKAVKKVARRYRGRRAILFLGRAVFADSWKLCGMEQLLMSYVQDPGFARDLGKIAVEYNRELHRLAVEAGVDVFVLGDDYAHKLGTMMSPDHFREFILPGLTEVVQNIKDAGACCIKHTDGNIWAIIQDLVDTGIDALGPLEPAADMDLLRVKERLGDRICVVGNVDVDLLCRGSVEEVRAATQSLVRRVSPGGGHILSSGNTITSAVRAENFRAMVETCRELGRYPIAAPQSS